MWIKTSGGSVINLDRVDGVRVFPQEDGGGFDVGAYIGDGYEVVSSWDAADKAETVLTMIAAALDARSHKEFTPQRQESPDEGAAGTAP